MARALATAFAASLAATAAADICASINATLPSYCHSSGFECLYITCDTMLFHDQITAQFGLDLCHSPVGIKMNVQSADPKISWADGIYATTNIPIPGLSIQVPDLPVSAGVYLNVALDGSKAGTFTAKVGLDACGHVPIVGTKCLPNPPLKLFEASLDTTGICEALAAREREEALAAQAALEQSSGNLRKGIQA